MSSNSKQEAPAGLELSSLSSETDSPVKVHDYKSDPDPSQSITLNNTFNTSQDLQSAIQDDSDTATNSSDEFDWEAEDDSASVKQIEARQKATRGKRVWSTFMRLARPVRTFLVGVLGVGIIITPLLIFQLRFHSNIARPHVHAWCLWLAITWAAACVTYMVVDLIPRFVIFIVTIFHGQVESLKTQLELILAVSGWLKLVLDVSWSWIALSVVRSTVKPPGSYWVIVNRVMQALFAASIILLVEKLFLRFVAIRFHQKALAERLAENKLALKALDRLSNASPQASRRSPYILGRKRGHKGTATSTGSKSASVDLLGKEVNASLSQANFPESKNTSKFVRKQKRKKAVASMIVDQLGGAIGQVALKDSRFNRGGEITGLHSARRLAKQLFSTLSNVYPPRSHLIVEDFYPYFRSTAEAHAAFAVFDKDNNGDITKKEMREAVQRIYRERKTLVASLKDVGSAVAKLDAVLVCLALIGIVFVCLLVFNRSNTLASLVPLATIILGFSFIFGHSAQTLFESLIFIFSTHVFDVGDLVLIDDQPLFVKEFGLFSTTFRRVDGQEIIAPNALLASSKLVHNLRRSNSMWESTNLTVSYDTPLEAIELLRTKLQAYVQQNNREWSNVGVNIDKMEYQNAITLIVAMEHRPNWQDWGGRWARRTLFMRYLKTVLEELDISYTLPVQPVLLPKGSLSRAVGPMNVPLRGYNASMESLGNAGHYRDEVYRAPSSTLRTDRGMI